MEKYTNPNLGFTEIKPDNPIFATSKVLIFSFHELQSFDLVALTLSLSSTVQPFFVKSFSRVVYHQTTFTGRLLSTCGSLKRQLLPAVTPNIPPKTSLDLQLVDQQKEAGGFQGKMHPLCLYA